MVRSGAIETFPQRSYAGYQRRRTLAIITQGRFFIALGLELALVIRLFTPVLGLARAVAAIPLIHPLLAYIIGTIAREHHRHRALWHIVPAFLLYASAYFMHPLVVATFSIISCYMSYVCLICWDVPPPPSLVGCVYLVTGASSGIGEEVTTQLLGLGATVLLACRSKHRGEAARVRALSRSGAPSSRAQILLLDLADSDSIKSCVENVNRLHLKLDGLVCNAGGIFNPRRENDEGMEINLAANAFGHHLLATLLISRLKDKFRVVAVSSSIHKKNGMGHHLRNDPMSRSYFMPYNTYAAAKVAQMIATFSLQNERVECVCVHPGTPITEVTRELPLIIQLLHKAVKPLALCLQTDLALAGATVVYACHCKVPGGHSRNGSRTCGGLYQERCEPVPHSISAIDLATVDHVCSLFESFM